MSFPPGPNSGAPAQGIPGAQRFNRLWIGGLPRNVAIDDVRAEVNRVFTSYGPVADVCVITTARDVMCFVQYEDDQVAFNAREDMNGKMILGSVIKVNYAVIRGPDAPKTQPRATGMPVPEEQSRVPRKDPNRKIVIVGNLPNDISSKELAKFGNMASHDVAFAKVWRDGSNTYGLLSFDHAVDARKAMKRLDGATVDRDSKGRKLRTFSLDDFNKVSKRSRSNSRDRRRR
jgi:RNA recognition motif-containing protein